MTEKSTHGGPGRGGGRKPIAGVGALRIAVTLDPATIERAKEIGAGNVSAGIRAAVACFKMQVSQPADASACTHDFRCINDGKHGREEWWECAKCGVGHLR